MNSTSIRATPGLSPGGGEGKPVADCSERITSRTAPDKGAGARGWTISTGCRNVKQYGGRERQNSTRAPPGILIRKRYASSTSLQGADQSYRRLKREGPHKVPEPRSCRGEVLFVLRSMPGGKGT